MPDKSSLVFNLLALVALLYLTRAFSATLLTDLAIGLGCGLAVVGLSILFRALAPKRNTRKTRQLLEGNAAS
jgi:hypothetical protein